VEGNNSDKCKEKINNLGSELEIEFTNMLRCLTLTVLVIVPLRGFRTRFCYS
jgi:hypothetical protein